VSCEQALLSATARESRRAAGRAPALQEFLDKGAAGTELVSDFLLRVVRMILKEQDDSFAEVIRILDHVKIMLDVLPYNQVKTDLRQRTTIAGIYLPRSTFACFPLIDFMFAT